MLDGGVGEARPDPRDRTFPFRLETLEPRVLLSADPILGELARVLHAPDPGGHSDHVPALVQELHENVGHDAAAVHEAKTSFAWPAAWAANTEDHTEQGPVDLRAVVRDVLEQALTSDETGSPASVDAAPREAASQTLALAVEGSGDVTVGNDFLRVLVADVLKELGPTATQQFADLKVMVGDLAGTAPAELRDGVLIIDADAGGRGWALDADSAAAGAVAVAALLPSAPQLAADVPAAAPGVPQEASGAPAPGLAVAGAAPTPTSDQPIAAQPADFLDEPAAPSTASAVDPGDHAQAPATEPVAPASTSTEESAPAPAPDARGAATTPNPIDSLSELLAALRGEGGAVVTDLALLGALSTLAPLRQNDRFDSAELAARAAGGSATDTASDGPLWAVTESDKPPSADPDSDAEARGPPAIQLVTNNAIAATSSRASVEADGAASSIEPEATDLSPVYDPLPRGPPADDALPRGPPATGAQDDSLAAVPGGDPEPATAEPSSVTDPKAGTDYLSSTGTPTTPSTTELTDLELQGIVAEALARWTASGLIPISAGPLTDLTFAIGDLPSGKLAEISGTVITVDVTADGFGWFVDATPTEDSEFAGAGPAGIDLLTAILHEIGHYLGYEHGAAGLDLMGATLAEGQRELPTLDASMSLNEVLDAVLAIRLDPATDSSPADFSVTAGTDAVVPGTIFVGQTPNGGKDLRLTGVTLTFSGLSYDTVNQRWTGHVAVEATGATLFAGLLDIAITDSPDDVDAFAAAGALDLAPGTTAEINFDQLDMKALGWPSFLEVKATQLVLNFSDFRTDDNLNSLSFTVDLLGFDSGIPLVNDLIRADNPLFGLKIEGSVSATLDIKDIEDTVSAAASGDIVHAAQAAIAAALRSGIDGVAGKISGNLFKVVSFEGGFIVKTVSYDPDGPGGQDPVSSTYLAVEAGGTLGEKLGRKGKGIIDKSLTVAFAISESGPLQFFIEGGGLKRWEFQSGLTLEQIRLGVRFNTNIQDLQIEPDYQATAGTWDSTRNEVTLTIPDHQLAVGNELRITDAANSNYNGDFTVLAVNGDDVTFGMPFDPGAFAGSANVIKLTITDALDLDDEGLSSGIAPPDSILAWRDQLDQAVLDQLRSGASWANLTGDVVFGGGATLSIDPIPDSVMLFDVDLLIDTDLRILLSGTFNVFDGLIQVPMKLYADLGLDSDAVRFLFLANFPEVPGFDPLLQFHAGVTFQVVGQETVRDATVTENTAGGYWDVELELAMDTPSDEFAVGQNAVVYAADPAGFEGTYEIVAVDDDANTITVRMNADPGTWDAADSQALVANENAAGGAFLIALEGGIDLNVPGVTSAGEPYTITTLSLGGPASLLFRLPGPGSTSDVEMEMTFDASLSETHTGAIGGAGGDFTAAFDADGGPVVGGVPTLGVDLWGGALLTSNFSFLEKYGLFADVSGVLLFNTTNEDKGPVRLTDDAGDPVDVYVPAQTFALRLDGSVGLRIDYNSDQVFDPATEQALLIEGTFVMSFAPNDGFNVVLFRESGNPAAPLAPATAKLGPLGNPFMTFDVFGFLAIRGDGVAASLTMSLDASAPGALAGVANVDAQFLLMLNTTGTDIEFDIPAGAVNPGGRSGVRVQLPRAPPSSIIDANLDITSVLNGNAWTLPANAVGAPYILIHAGGTNPSVDPNATLTVGPFSLVGQFSFLLGAEVDPGTHAVTPLLEILGNFSLDISVGPLTFLQLEGSGYLRFDGHGLVTAIDFTQRAGASIPSASVGFDMSVSFRLELNARDDGTFSFDHDNDPNTANVVIAPGFRLHMAGSLEIVNLLTIDGTFDLTIDQHGVQLAMAGHFDLLGVRASLSADASITDRGFAFDAQLTLDTPGLAVVPGLFNVKGTFLLSLDTIHHTASIGIANANVNLMGLVMSGSITIGVDRGEFYIVVPMSDPLTLNFFGVASLSVSGSFNYNAATGGASGTHGFNFTATAGLTIGVPGVLGVQGTLSVTFDSAKGAFTGTVSGTAWIVGIAFHADATLKISGSAISLYVHVSVTITPAFDFWVPFHTVHVPALIASYSHTFNIGNTTPAEAYVIPSPDPPELAHIENGVLYLNIGVDANRRDPNDDWDDEDLDESFQITHVGGTAGNETVLVDAFGFQKEFSGVTKIVATDAGLGADVIDVASGVLAAADLNGGDGDDRISYLGSGHAVLRGGKGNDDLTGGTGGTAALPDELFGGDDNDRLTGGAGVTNVYGEDGDDTIIWNQVGGAMLGVVDGGADTGGDFRDGLQVLIDGAADTAAVSPATAGAFDLAIDGVVTRAGGVEGLILDMMGAGDTVTIDDLTASDLKTVVVRLGDDDGAQDHVIVNGSAGAENIDLSTIDADGQNGDDTLAIDYDSKVSITIEQGDAAGGNLALGDRLTVNGNGGLDAIDASGVLTQLLNIDFEFGNDGTSLLGSSFADLFDIDVIGNTAGVLNIDGGGGGDSYVVNLRGGDTDTDITIGDSGSSGTDTLVVNGTAGVEHITLTGTFLKQGSNSEVLNYSGIDVLTVNTLGDADEVTILSTYAGPVTLNSGDGDDVIAVRSVSGPTTIDTGSGTDRINVGSLATIAANTGGTLNAIGASLTIGGGADGGDVLDLDDSGDTAANTTGQLTAAALTGLGTTSGSGYGGIEDLRVHLGSGDDQFLVLGTYTQATRIDDNGGNDTISVRAIGGATTIDAGAGDDRVNVGSNASASGNTGGTVNAIGAPLTVAGGAAGADVLDVDDGGDGAANTGELTGMALTGLGMASGIAYGTIEDLRIHLGAGNDQLLVTATHAGATTVDGNGGGDTISVRTIAGPTTIDTGAGDDRVNVGSNASAGGNTGGTVDAIGALLTVAGGAAGTDVLDVDDSGDGTPNLDGQLSATALTGLGMASGIGYGAVEDLRVHLGTGDDQFVVAATHTGTTAIDGNGGGDTISVRAIAGPTTIDAGAGDDRVNVGSNASAGGNTGGTVDAIGALLTIAGGAAGTDLLDVDDSGDTSASTGQLTGTALTGLGMASGIGYSAIEDLRIHLGAGDDLFTVAATHAGTTTVDANEGADGVDVLTTALGSRTYLNGGTGVDTFDLGNAGRVDGVHGLVVIDGGLADDRIDVDDAASSVAKVGVLTSGSLRGLAMNDGIDYSNAEDLNVWLGTGTDTFYVASTHTGTTQVYAGDGADTIAVGTIGGVTTLHGQGGNDGILVNVQTGGGTTPPLFGLTPANDDQFERTNGNGLDTAAGAIPLNLHGEAGSDHYVVNLAGEGQALINVFDGSGTDDGIDDLIVNGADQVADPNDTFLLRRNFVALLNTPAGDAFTFAERVNYDHDINGTLFVNGLAGDDKFVSDDNGAVTVLDGGEGDDTFQIGQIFGTPRDANANLAVSDRFDTTAVIIGAIADPATGDPIFDPTAFDVGADSIPPETLQRIRDAIVAQNGQPLDGIAYLSAGVSFKTTARGGEGDDTFRVYRNVGELTLEGQDGNDEFVVRGFVTLDSGAAQQADTTISGGGDADLIEYAINAPVHVDGGDGFDTMLVLGTPFGDVFVVTNAGVFGAGRSVSYENLESITVDALEGDDQIFVVSTNEDVVTRVVGGLGSDVIEVGGDVPSDVTIRTAVSGGADARADEHSPQDLVSIAGPLIVAGGVGDLADQSLQAAPVMLPGELNGTSNAAVPTRNEGDDLDVLTIFDTDDMDPSRPAHLYDRLVGASGTVIENPGIALTGLGMGPDLTVGGMTYGGGITMRGFEVVELLLGPADETLTVDVTLDGAVTAIHGGGGGDTITVNGRGAGAPLIVYGDTSEDRARYDNADADAPSRSGSTFDNDGNDTIDASGMQPPSDGFVGIVLYGGGGDDIITGSRGDDQLAGGTGADTIDGADGNDAIYGDSHFNVDVTLAAEDQLPLFVPTADEIARMFVVVSEGMGEGDTLYGGAGNDVLFGDHGVVERVAGTRPIETTGSIVAAHTTDIANGAGDTIHGGADDDLVFGGKGGDTLFGDGGSDLIFGDHGSVAGAVDLGLIGAVDGAGVTNPLAAFRYASDISPEANLTAGNDTIYGGSAAVLDTAGGSNILLGQQGDDTIYGGGGEDDIYGGHDVAGGVDGNDAIDGGAGNDVILGDNGLIERRSDATDPRFAVLVGTVIYDTDGLIQVASGDAGIPGRLVRLSDHDETAGASTHGNDTIAGGADDDLIFGELGDDTLHGDGRLVPTGSTFDVAMLTGSIPGADIGGDDHVEGNGGDDTIFGGLGQDDLVGGSSSLYGLGSPTQRPDGSDTIFGGNGDLFGRNDAGDGATYTNETGGPLAAADRHARDADVILGDNGNIYRLVGINGTVTGALTFAYDTYSATRHIVVRAAELLDYTPGGLDASSAASDDRGAADALRGEAGDDAIYGMVGDDILFGDAQSDDLIGGYGNDWISGGTDVDGLLGDDGRILTSRNTSASSGLPTETLYGIGYVTVNLEISTPGDIQHAVVNAPGQLQKTAVLSPFNVQGGLMQDPLFAASDANDIIYGGLGDDFLHGGSGDDAISGAEALPQFFVAPMPMADALGFDPDTLQFAAYNEFDPRSRIYDESGEEFLLNFEASDGPAIGTVHTDGNDRIFGDLGNDWLVGGTGNDHLYGGWGDDLLNADDNLDTSDTPDTAASYEDIAYGGAGRDILIANTGGDRLIDWAGAFNTYLVPFAANGAFTISRSLQPRLFEYLYDLSESDGADPFLGSDPLRNGEPEGELGLVIQKDFAWQDQTGAPMGIQPGNIPGGPRDVLRGADFNTAGATDVNGQINGFAADSGAWSVSGGRLSVSPTTRGGDAVSVFYVDDVLPSYFEVTATINAGKPTAGSKSNAYLIFDYQSPTNFKFAGVNVSTNKLVMGHRTAAGWIIDEQTPAQLKPDRDYNLLLSLNGSVATLVVDNAAVFTHVYAPRADVYGVLHGLSDGMVGLGAGNSTARIDNVRVQVLPPETTFEATETFDAPPAAIAYESGTWSLGAGALLGAVAPGGTNAIATVDLDVRAAYVLTVSATLQTDGSAGFIFDRNGTENYKFAVISPATSRVLIGHYTTRGGVVVDQTATMALNPSTAHNVKITLVGTTVSVVVDGSTVLGYAFNANVVDGAFGLLSLTGSTSVESLSYLTNDPQYLAPRARR
jgi:Ca2+-binding RTX toxin-like protein